MSLKSSEFKVGLFTIFGLSVLGYMLFVLSPDSFKNSKRSAYYTILKDAAGIVTKTHVKTNGVVIGKVKNISLQVNDTRIDIEVDSTVKIPVGSKVAIKEKGLLGDVYLEVFRSEDAGEYLQPGDMIPPDFTQTNLSSLISIGGSIAQDIKKITSSLSGVIGGEDGSKTVGNIVGDIRVITSDLREILSSNKNDLRSVVMNLEGATARIRKLLDDKDNDVRQLITNLRHFSQSANEVLSEENKAKLNHILETFDKSMENVEVISKDIRTVAQRIERGEGTLGRLISDDKALAEFEDTLRDVKTLLRPAVKMQMDVDYHGEFRRDETTQHSFNVLLKPRADKFYLLGFTDVGESTKEVITEELSPSDHPSKDAMSNVKSRTRTTERKAIRFNVQFAKRWDWVQMRFGLFETTGGLAMDFGSEKIRWTTEAFSWDNRSIIRKTAHIKSYLSFLFFNHIYAMIGVDDPTKYREDSDHKISTKTNFFVGTGLTFNDQDLKSIFGTAALAL